MRTALRQGRTAMASIICSRHQCVLLILVSRSKRRVAASGRALLDNNTDCHERDLKKERGDV